VRIYLACTIRGDRSRLAVARAVLDRLIELGHDVMTARFLDEHAEDADGTITEAEVFRRDLDWLDRADVLVAEASGSSYGVGFEVGYVLGRAAETGKRAIVLYDGGLRDRISRMIVGTAGPHAAVCGYRDAAEAVAFVTNNL
jgi:nucleoside 2-deoxyribosyltransferase